MRRRRLNQLKLDTYPMMTQAEKEWAQETVFELYYDRNGMWLDAALSEIHEDIMCLEEQERYERCQILKDILDRFE